MYLCVDKITTETTSSEYAVVPLQLCTLVLKVLKLLLLVVFVLQERISIV